MALSRPFLLALIGAVLLGATFFAVQNARDNTGDAAPAAQSQAKEQAGTPATPAAPAASPAEILKAAFNPGKLDSTAFAAKLSASGGAERVAIELSGAYEKGAANDVPKLALDAKIAVAGDKLEGGFVSLGDEAYFTRGDTGWQVPDEVWNPLVEAAADGAGARGRQQLPLGIDPGEWVRDVKSDGTETLDGVETTHVSAAIDPKRVAQDLVGLARRNGAPLPSADQAARAVKRAELDAWVGTDDRLLRRLSAELAFAVPRDLRGPNDAARGEIAFDLRLTDVNRAQDIEAPATVREGLPDGLFGKFAQGLTSGLAGLGGGQPVSVEALRSPNPRRAARAVGAGKRVVVLFRNPVGLDDRAMAKVMRALDRRTQAVVLTDHVDAVDRYGELVEDLGVSQTPSVVLIDRSGKARLIEGYVDTDTLAQAVADAR